MARDVEKQQKSGAFKTSLKQRILIFLDHYFGSLKLYLCSFPMPDGTWDNRKWRLKATGVQIAMPVRGAALEDRLIVITQRQPSERADF